MSDRPAQPGEIVDAHVHLLPGRLGEKVRAFFETQKVWSAYNSVGMCDFVGAPLNALDGSLPRGAPQVAQATAEGGFSALQIGHASVVVAAIRAPAV